MRRGAPMQGIILTMVGRVPFAVFAHPDYLAKRGTPERLADLERHAILFWNENEAVVEEWPLVDGGTVPVRATMITSNLYTIRDHVSAGNGMALMPKMAGEDLVEVMPGQLGGIVKLWWVAGTSAAAEPRMQMMLAMGRRLFRGLLQPD